MLVRELMTPQVEAVTVEMPVEQAAKKMRALDIGPLPVCDQEKVVGMITDRDITVRVVADGLDAAQTPVRDVMTESIVSCYDDQEHAEAAQLMQSLQIRRLAVVDHDYHLIGMLSLGDLARAGVKDTAAETLTSVSKDK